MRHTLLSISLALASLSFTTPVAAQTSSVVINEFLAKNDSGIKDEQSQLEDWIELYNPTSAAIDISGWYISDTSAKPTKWAFPKGTTIAAKGTLLVWADDDEKDGPLHTNFKLTTAGEEIVLTLADGKTTVDSLKFGTQVADISGGRLTDGGKLWVTFDSPTPKALNAPAQCGIRTYNQQLSTNHRLSLAATGTAKIGSTLTIDLTKAAAGKNALLFGSDMPSHTALPGTIIVLLFSSPWFGPFSIKADTGGKASLALKIPNNKALVGIKIYAQGAAEDATSLTASNAVEVTICP